MTSATRSPWWRSARGVLAVRYVHRFFQLYHFGEHAVRVQIRFTGDLRRPDDPFWFKREAVTPGPDLEALWRSRVRANIRQRRLKAACARRATPLPVVYGGHRIRSSQVSYIPIRASNQ